MNRTLNITILFILFFSFLGKAQDSTFILLENRLSISLPKDFLKKLERTNIMGPLPSEREFVEVYIDKDDEYLSITFRETYAKSSENIKSDIAQNIKEWKSMGTEFSLKNTFINNDLIFYQIVPEKLQTDKSVFIKEAYYIELKDKSLISCAVTINKKALDNIIKYDTIINNLFSRIKLGLRTINKSGELVESNMKGGSTISFTMPFDGLIVPQDGYDYTVIKIIRLDNLNLPSSQLTLYFGMHPQHILDEMIPKEMKNRIKSKKGKAFNKKLEWNYIYPNKTEQFQFLQEAFFKTGNNFYHFFIKANNESELEKLENTIDSMTEKQ